MEQDNTYNELNTLFHDTFADWETPAPANVWNKVEAALEQEGKKRPGAWWWFSGAILLLLGFGLWYFWPMIHSSTPNTNKSSVISNKQIDNHKIDSINAAMLAIKKHDDSLASVIKMKTDSLSTNDSSLNSANANPTQTISPKTENITAKTTEARNQYSQSFSTSTQAKPSPVQIKKANYIRTDSLLSALPSATSSKNARVTFGSKKDSIKDKVVTTNTNQKQSATENSTQQKQNKKDSSVMQKSIATTEESMTSSSQAKPTTKRKDSTLTNKDSTIQQNKINAAIAKTDSLVQQKKADSLLSSKKDSKDSLKKDSLVKAAKKDSTTKSSSFPRLSISGYFSPELARIDVTANNSKFNAQNVTPQAKYSSGVKLGYTLNKRVQLSIGLSYSQFHQDFHSDTVSFPKTISQSFVFNSVLGDMSVPAATMLAGYSPFAPVSRFRFNYEYNQTVQFINVPITARFNFGIGKLKPYINAGVNLQYAFSQHATLDLMKETQFQQVDYNMLEVRTINFAATVGLGTEYDFSKHLGAYVEPNSRINMQSNSTNSTVTSKSSFVGCQAGITFQF